MDSSEKIQRLPTAPQPKHSYLSWCPDESVPKPCGDAPGTPLPKRAADVKRRKKLHDNVHLFLSPSFHTQTSEPVYLKMPEVSPDPDRSVLIQLARFRGSTKSIHRAGQVVEAGEGVRMLGAQTLLREGGPL